MSDGLGRGSSTWGAGLAHVFAGAGMGLLLGLVVGLSASPVVKTILATLAALVGAFLGLKGDGAEPTEGTSKRSFGLGGSLRAGGFGLCCAVGILAGVAFRAHGTLGPSVGERVRELQAAGFPDPEARELVRRTMFDDVATPAATVPATGEGGEVAAAPVAGPVSAGTRPMLVSGDGQDFCQAVGTLRADDALAVREMLVGSSRPELKALGQALAGVTDAAAANDVLVKLGGVLCDVCTCK